MTDELMEYFKAKGLYERIIETEESTETVADAAKTLGTTEEHIAKSITFLLGERVILILAAGDRKIDNKKYKDTFGMKAKMIPYDLVKQKIGHAPGGVCPFHITKECEVYMDESLRSLDVIYPAAGSANSCIKTTPEELASISDNFKGYVDVCKMPSAE